MARVASRLVLAALVALLVGAPVGPEARPQGPRCPTCVLDPVLLEPGVRQGHVFAFSAEPGREAELWIQPLGKTRPSAAIRLNGLPVGDDAQGWQLLSHGLTRIPVLLEALNVLEVVFGPETGWRVRLQVRQRPGVSLEERTCPDPGPVFSHPPTTLEDVLGIVPLGSVNPPEHTLPSHHVYVYVGLPGATTAPVVDVYAPGRMKLVGAIRHGPRDYELHLKPCREVRLYVIHLSRLAPRIAAALPALDDLCLRGFCAERADLLVGTGERLGTVDGTEHWAFDLGVIDARRPPHPFANPGRYRVPASLLEGLTPEQRALVDLIAPDDLRQQCALDYFAPALRAAMQRLLGEFDGSVPRTAAPRCGAYAQDVPGTAQGNWFLTAEDTVFSEERGVALVRDAVDPAVPVLSVGTEVTGLDSAAYWFLPAADPRSRTNVDFPGVAPGDVYCYEGLVHRTAPLPGVVLVELFSSGAVPADRLRLEYLPAAVACAEIPWTFSGAATVFER